MDSGCRGRGGGGRERGGVRRVDNSMQKLDSSQNASKAQRSRCQAKRGASTRHLAAGAAGPRRAGAGPQRERENFCGEQRENTTQSGHLICASALCAFAVSLSVPQCRRPPHTPLQLQAGRWRRRAAECDKTSKIDRKKSDSLEERSERVTQSAAMPCAKKPAPKTRNAAARPPAAARGARAAHSRRRSRGDAQQAAQREAGRAEERAQLKMSRCSTSLSLLLLSVSRAAAAAAARPAPLGFSLRVCAASSGAERCGGEAREERGNTICSLSLCLLCHLQIWSTDPD